MDKQVSNQEIDLEKIKTLLKERRKLLNINHWYGNGIEAEMVDIFRAYENTLAHARDNADKYMEHILSALYGIRFCINAMLNETWTHRQKDAQMLAIGAMVETGIAAIKHDQHIVATEWSINDPFTPSWSRDGIYKRATDAEAKLHEQGERIRRLEELLAANGIDATVSPEFSTDRE